MRAQFVEACHGNQVKAPRPVLVSRLRVNAAGPSPLSLGPNVARASSTGKSISPRSWAETTHVHACQVVGFKNCCMQTGEFEGSDRDHLFLDHESGAWPVSQHGPADLGMEPKSPVY